MIHNQAFYIMWESPITHEIMVAGFDTREEASKRLNDWRYQYPANTYVLVSNEDYKAGDPHWRKRQQLEN